MVFKGDEQSERLYRNDVCRNPPVDVLPGPVLKLLFVNLNAALRVVRRGSLVSEEYPSSDREVGWDNGDSRFPGQSHDGVVGGHQQRQSCICVLEARTDVGVSGIGEEYGQRWIDGEEIVKCRLGVRLGDKRLVSGRHDDLVVLYGGDGEDGEESGEKGAKPHF